MKDLTNHAYDSLIRPIYVPLENRVKTDHPNVSQEEHQKIISLEENISKGVGTTESALGTYLMMAGTDFYYTGIMLKGIYDRFILNFFSNNPYPAPILDYNNFNDTLIATGAILLANGIIKATTGDGIIANIAKLFHKK